MWQPAHRCWRSISRIAPAGPGSTKDTAHNIEASGEFVVHKSGQATTTAPRPQVEFIKDMPRHFQDPLPVLADKLKERKLEPKREHEVSYEEVEGWLKANLGVRKGFVKRFQGRARDPEFRSALLKNLREHPEWDRTLFPEKYEAKEKKGASDGVKTGP